MPCWQGFGNASIRAAGAKAADLNYSVLIERFVLRHRDRDTW